MPALSAQEISFVTISQATDILIGTCFCMTYNEAVIFSYVSTLHALHFHDTRGEINNASPLKSECLA